VHFGVISVPISSHVSALIGLAMRLRQRGHRITVFHIADIERMVCDAGLEFRQIGATGFPPGAMAARDKKISGSTGLAGFRLTIDYGLRHSEMLLEEAPEAIRAAEIDMLLVDQAEPAGSTLAEGLGLPFVSIALALPLPESDDASVPPFFVGWRYRPGLLGRLRNRAALRLFMRSARPFFALLNPWRAASGLPPMPAYKPEFTRRALIAQLPECMDFPQHRLRPDFHYAGPFSIETARPPIDFPWDRIDGRPLVYAGFGNQPAQSKRKLQAIALAAAQLNMQMVISLGRFTSAEEIGQLPGDPIVVPVAPQLDLIRRAALVVIHGGLNTTLEALWFGVPMIVIPITNDQPGVAARIEWAGAGQVIAARGITGRRVRIAMQNILSRPQYRQAASRLSAQIRAAGGLNHAVDIIERVSRVEQPATQTI
jgi:zeaxanthin glucosyltransferase